jgi:hypothetical protein
VRIHFQFYNYTGLVPRAVQLFRSL